MQEQTARDLVYRLAMTTLKERGWAYTAGLFMGIVVRLAQADPRIRRELTLRIDRELKQKDPSPFDE